MISSVQIEEIENKGRYRDDQGNEVQFWLNKWI